MINIANVDGVDCTIVPTVLSAKIYANNKKICQVEITLDAVVMFQNKIHWAWVVRIDRNSGWVYTEVRRDPSLILDDIVNDRIIPDYNHKATVVEYF